MNLHDLIKTLDLSQCMLTLADARGFAGALYFKDEILIEANTEDSWGMEALAMILSFQITEYRIVPMPVGIVPALAYTVEQLKDAFSKIPVQTPEVVSSFPKGWQSFEELPGLMTLSRMRSATTLETLWRANPDEVADTWAADVVQKISALGETLALGRLERLSACTEEVRVQASALPNGTVFSVHVTQTDWQTLDSLFEKAVKEVSL